MSLKVKEIYENAFREEMKEDFNYNKYKEDMVWFGKECQINLMLDMINNFKNHEELTLKQFVDWNHDKLKELEPKGEEQ